jgi:hypothetical protein
MAPNLDVTFGLEDAGQGRLLSTPRVSTQNNVEAEITQGVQIPIQTVANNTVTVTFKDAALTLKVTPQITASDTVIMRISVENASPDFSRSIKDIPPIDTQRAIATARQQRRDDRDWRHLRQSRTVSRDRTPGLPGFRCWVVVQRKTTGRAPRSSLPRIIRLRRDCCLGRSRSRAAAAWVRASPV